MRAAILRSLSGLLLLTLSTTASAERLELARDLVVSVGNPVTATVFRTGFNCVYLSTAESSRSQFVSITLRSKICIDNQGVQSESSLDYTFDVIADYFSNSVSGRIENVVHRGRIITLTPGPNEITPQKELR